MREYVLREITMNEYHGEDRWFETEAVGRPTKPRKNILILGIDDAGKTSLLNQFKKYRGLTSMDMVFPTMGQNSEDILYKKHVFSFTDLAGRKELRRTMWGHYFKEADGIVYVVDAVNRDRFTESLEELHKIMHSPELANAPICVCANKQDEEGALDASQLAEAWELHGKMAARSYLVVGTIGGGMEVVRKKKSMGIHDLFSWLYKTFRTDPNYQARFRALRIRAEEDSDSDEEAA